MKWAALVACLAAPAVAEEVSAPGPAGPLKGAYLQAEDEQALALIIPGSGPIDRDGNNTLGMTTNLYRQLAEGLGAQGISTIRIDKRGMFSSAAAVSDANDVTIGAYAADIRNWVATHQGARDCVWLIGHSEGALVAFHTVAHGAENVCGVVSLAGPGRPLGAILREQLAASPAMKPELLEVSGRIIASLEVGQAVSADQVPPALAGLFAPGLQRYMVDLFSHDPAALAGKSDLPLLILQGGQDLQITGTDAAALTAARPDAQRVDFTQLNHMFKLVPHEDVATNFATYFDGELPVGQRVVPQIVQFLTAN